MAGAREQVVAKLTDLPGEEAGGGVGGNGEDVARANANRVGPFAYDLLAQENGIAFVAQ